MNLRSLRKHTPLIGAATFVVAIVIAFITLQSRTESKQDFELGVDNSLAFKTIRVTSVSLWDVQMEVTYSDRQRQAYLDKVSRRIVSTGSGATWRPTQHLPLSLTVSNLDNGSPQLVHAETIDSESFYSGGDHAGFLTIAQLRLDPGKYLVSIRTLKADPTLREFGARLLVGRHWE